MSIVFRTFYFLFSVGSWIRSFAGKTQCEGCIPSMPAEKTGRVSEFSNEHPFPTCPQFTTSATLLLLGTDMYV